MANKRIFVAFAIEDEKTKILFTGQAKNKNVPYDFVDMSVKQPWDEKWKTNCRTRIKGCDGLIVLVSKNLKNADGAIWEIKCGKEEKIPMIGIYIDGGTFSDKPSELSGVTCKEWTWDNVKNFIESV
ncbi:MAG: hypothetical protein COA97_10375 [Flavobacteriales bacterium]|nr:MAG: hypothetical protein COA97_10375 [Flavobacteriales bacterium]